MLPFRDFIQTLPEYGIAVNLHQIFDFYRGLKKSLVRNLDELFLLSRLAFIKKKEDLDAFERAFARHFYDIDFPRHDGDDFDVFDSREFREWLKQARENGSLEKHPNLMPREELLRRFWETVREQMKEHHGGSKWVGTGGKSPFGHSGNSLGGVRVFGEGGNFSALKIIGERRYIALSDKNTLRGENIRQAMEALKKLEPAGAYTELNIHKTIDATAKNGGELEFVFDRQLRDKLEVILFIDNGGSSMLPHTEKVRELFEKMRGQFRKLTTYYFHNTVYSFVYKDQRHRQPYALHKIMESPDETRIFFLGDASMGPEELLSPYGGLYFHDDDPEPSVNWYLRMKQRFPHMVWLNPIPREHWSQAYGRYTLNKIASLIQMEDMSLAGLKKAVEYLNRRRAG